MNVQFREKNQGEFSTCFGTFLSFLILAIVLIHGYSKFVVMHNREDSRHQTVIEQAKSAFTLFDG